MLWLDIVCSNGIVVLWECDFDDYDVNYVGKLRCKGEIIRCSRLANGVFGDCILNGVDIEYIE